MGPGGSGDLPSAGSSTSIPAGSAPADGAEATLVGEILDGRYRVTKKLGEGGMGEVYAAEHIHIVKKVAIKLLRPEIVSNQEAVTRFRQEAHSASSIGHKNIIGILDYGQLKDGRIYLCMELLDGAPLNDLIKTPLPADRLLNILIQTGHGLAAAHAKNIVHRDMKPENIFVTTGPSGEDVPKLLDFGIAKVAGQDGQNNLTRTGTIFGTPYYMAPEQALGQSVDGRCDIYAMGVICYEVFAGSLPFMGESFMGILTQHITTEPEPVAQRAAKAGRTLPPGLAEVIARAMAKDPDKRYRTMDEFVNGLVEVYRTMAGAGMSSYLEAFKPATGMMPAAGSSGMPPAMPGRPSIPPGASAPTVVAGAMPGLASPTPAPYQGQPPYGAGQPPYGAQPHPHAPSGPYPAPGASASAPYFNPDSSQFQMAEAEPPKKGKAGLIAALLLVVMVAGGVAAAIVLSGKKKDKEGGGDDPVAVATDAAVVAVATPDAAGAVATGDPIDAGAAATDEPIDAGQLAALEVDAGDPGVPPDPVDPPDAGTTGEPSIDIAVLVSSNARGAVVWVDGKAVGKAPKIVKVTPGTTHEVTVKAKGYEDKTITVDGLEEEVKVRLKALPGTKPPKLDCTKPENAMHPDCMG
jgi:tRNA A-37 threonylcarbamoyl transferase component Bud32